MASAALKGCKATPCVTWGATRTPGSYTDLYQHQGEMV